MGARLCAVVVGAAAAAGVDDWACLWAIDGVLLLRLAAGVPPDPGVSPPLDSGGSTPADAAAASWRASSWPWAVCSSVALLPYFSSE